MTQACLKKMESDLKLEENDDLNNLDYDPQKFEPVTQLTEQEEAPGQDAENSQVFKEIVKNIEPVTQLAKQDGLPGQDMEKNQTYKEIDAFQCPVCQLKFPSR